MEAGLCRRLQITPRRRSLGTGAAVLLQQCPVFSRELFLGQLGRFLPPFYTSEKSDPGAHIEGTLGHLWFFLVLLYRRCKAAGEVIEVSLHTHRSI